MAGSGARHEFRCHACGFGARRSMAPTRCPMCGGSVWVFVPPQGPPVPRRELGRTAA